MSVTVGIVFGTYMRRALLEQCVASLRRSVGSLSYEIVIVDGGSTDGTREWLAQQPDVVPIFQDLPLTGAVIAFNLGFARALDDGVEFIVVFNDDDVLIGPEPEIQRCVEIMRAEPAVGAVAFEMNSRGKWECELWAGVPYLNTGVIRCEAGMAAARAQGDLSGRAWWGSTHHTYAADTECGLWIWRLGWEIRKGVGLRARNCTPHDDLQNNNVRHYAKSGTADIFTQRWGNAQKVRYSREDAERFGGVRW